jgi:hypothetical protein
MGRTVGATGMSNLTWATRKPTNPSWYWFRGERDGQTVKLLHFIDDDGDAPYIAMSEDLALND